jgi:hypothetical protein
MLFHMAETCSIPMKKQLFFLAATSILLVLQSGEAAAWGPQAHTAIGQATIAQVRDRTRSSLHAILGAESQDDLNRAIAYACFWPDTIRDDSAWSGSAPLHYVNIPRGSRRYDRQRDCPDGLCVTEGIKKYAADLAWDESSDVAPDPSAHTGQWRSFAWLCHLVADLHQPLHAGFADDRGANLVNVEFHGERLNLHRFWDSALAAERLSSDRSRLPPNGPADGSCPAAAWAPDLVVCWTNESHALASTVAYPPGPVISDAFADQSWSIIREQWWKAADRLALILDAALADQVRETGTADWRKPGAA